MSEINIQDNSRGNVTLNAMQAVGQDEQVEMRAEQLSSKQSFLESQEQAINPFAAKFATKDKEIKTHKSRVQKMKEAGGVEKTLTPVDKINDTAEKFQGRNPELRSNILALLREKIKPGDTKEEILAKLAEFYPDVTLADEALEFLLETTDGELAETVKEAKEDFGNLHSREIAAGKNIGTQARDAAGKGLGTTTSMRDMYREITGNPRDSTTLFEELSTKYAFKDLKKVIDFLLHSLGADMKAKGPSIPRGLLHRLLSETRSLQAILGVYRFFRGRMRLVEKMFHEQKMDMPEELSFETMAKQFMSLAQERYPSSGKVFQTAIKLGIEKWITAKIIVFSQMRDAVREVAMNLIFKSLQHRDELYMSILEALEDLEDQLEELMEKEERGDDDDDDDAKDGKDDGKEDEKK
ncbi:MAG TPA: HrpJ domain-containing protein [Parachlamydiaceae bacterium]|nr:HrpJ domain-containing protein [Parachlamydiaceae bacterium]